MPTPLARRRATTLAMLLVAGVASGGAGPGPPAAEATAPCAPAGFADIVQRARPAVVAVAAAPAERGPAAAVMADTTSLQTAAARPAAAGILGSGFFIDPEGHVVTNDHIVAGASQVTVTLEDGRSLDGAVVGRDPPADLALLHVAADGPLPFLPLGDSARVRPGRRRRRRGLGPRRRGAWRRTW
jgi:serine protease Do